MPNALTPSSQNPNDPKTKKNHLRQYFMNLLEALGLEKLLSSRTKRIAEVYVASKEQTFAEDALTTPKGQEAAILKLPEFDLLERLFKALQEMVQNVLSAAKSAVRSGLSSAVKSGKISSHVATAVGSAAGRVFSEDFLGKVLDKTKAAPQPKLTKKELDEVPEEFRDIVEEADNQYQENMNARQAKPVEKTQVIYNLAITQEFARAIKESLSLSADRAQARQAFQTIILPNSGNMMNDLYSGLYNVMSAPEYSQAASSIGTRYGTFRPVFVSGAIDQEAAQEILRAAMNNRF